MNQLDISDPELAVLIYAYIVERKKRSQHTRDINIGLEVRRRNRKPRSCWFKQWLSVESRLQYGHYTQLLNAELRCRDVGAYINYLRIAPALFDEILQRILPIIEKQRTRFREPICPGLQLALVLRHLATGDKYPSLSYAFRCSRSSICRIVPTVCKAIVAAYKDEVMACPVSIEEWKTISDLFEKQWNVPHALGALDGKHVSIKMPAKSGSLYHNYKGFFSIPLLALVDAEYTFIWIEISGMGHMSDAQIFKDTELFDCLEDGTLGIPPPIL